MRKSKLGILERIADSNIGRKTRGLVAGAMALGGAAAADMIPIYSYKDLHQEGDEKVEFTIENLTNNGQPVTSDMGGFILKYFPEYDTIKSVGGFDYDPSTGTASGTINNENESFYGLTAGEYVDTIGENANDDIIWWTGRDTDGDGMWGVYNTDTKSLYLEDGKSSEYGQITVQGSQPFPEFPTTQPSLVNSVETGIEPEQINQPDIKRVERQGDNVAFYWDGQTNVNYAVETSDLSSTNWTEVATYSGVDGEMGHTNAMDSVVGNYRVNASSD